ncbi:hypothetical protein [Paenibacillus agilis]|uniref:hypothetical protein n=1 Tax=Paenibacillus agilis TaxID=3020863 RepID=UPI003AB16E21
MDSGVLNQIQLCGLSIVWSQLIQRNGFRSHICSVKNKAAGNPLSALFHFITLANFE